MVDNCDLKYIVYEKACEFIEFHCKISLKHFFGLFVCTLQHFAFSKWTRLALRNEVKVQEQMLLFPRSQSDVNFLCGRFDSMIRFFVYVKRSQTWDFISLKSNATAECGRYMSTLCISLSSHLHSVSVSLDFMVQTWYFKFKKYNQAMMQKQCDIIIADISFGHFQFLDCEIKNRSQLIS